MLITHPEINYLRPPAPQITAILHVGQQQRPIILTDILPKPYILLRTTLGGAEIGSEPHLHAVKLIAY